MSVAMPHKRSTALHEIDTLLKQTKSINILRLTHLGNCLWRVFSVQSTINTLLYLIFTQLWCCLVSKWIKQFYIMEMGNYSCIMQLMLWENGLPMSQDFVVPWAVYDQLVYGQSTVPGVPHQSCIHHSSNSAGQSLHIYQPKFDNSQATHWGKKQTSQT